jgi:excisionase family DNA binding protein
MGLKLSQNRVIWDEINPLAIGTDQMMTERQTLKIEEAAKILGISRNTAYDAVKTGQLPTVKIGRRFLVPKVALDRLLQNVAPAAA